METKKIKFEKDEALIAEAILEGRKVQEYIWQELSLFHKPYNPEVWRIIFEKRVKKISELDMNNSSYKIELRKRILQQAALSILALKVLDKD